MPSTILRHRFVSVLRQGSMNNNRLYHEILPDLISRGHAHIHDIKGTKKKYYLFKADE